MFWQLTILQANTSKMWDSGLENNLLALNSLLAKCKMSALSLILIKTVIIHELPLLSKCTFV